MFDFESFSERSNFPAFNFEVREKQIEYFNEQLNKILQGVRDIGGEFIMDSTIRQGWMGILKRFAIQGTQDRNIVTTQNQSPIGLFTTYDLGVSTLSQAMNESEVLKQRVQTPMELDIHFILEKKCASHPWLYFSNNSCAFGGKNYSENLKTFLNADFQSGFCYLNLLVPFSFEIQNNHTEEFRQVLESTPEILGAYPSFSSVLNMLLYYQKRFPELVSSPIPVIAFDPQSLQLHVCDKRGVPATWAFLQAQHLSDLLTLAVEYRDADFMAYPVGGVESKYANWRTSMDHYITDRFVEMTVLADRLTNIIQATPDTEGGDPAAGECLNTMGFTNVVARSKRFPETRNITDVLVDLNDDIIYEPLDKLKLFLLVAHRSVQSKATIPTQIKAKCRAVLDTLRISQTSEIPAYSREKFEITNRVVWNSEFHRIHEQKEKLATLHKWFEDFENNLPSGSINPEPSSQSSELQTSAGGQDGTDVSVQNVRIVEITAKRSYWAEIIVGVVTTLLGAALIFIINLFRRRRARLVSKDTFPWKSISFDEGDEDGGDEGPPSQGRRQGGLLHHPAPSQSQSASEESIDQLLTRLNADRDRGEDYTRPDESQIQEAENHLTMVKLWLSDNRFTDIERCIVDTLSSLSTLNEVSEEGTPYQILADYLRKLVVAYREVETTGETADASLVELKNLELHLIRLNFLPEMATPSQALTKAVIDSKAKQWINELKSTSSNMGEELISSLEALVQRIDTQVMEGFSEYDELTACLIRRLVRIIKTVDGAASDLVKSEAVSSADAILAELNARSGANISMIYLSSVRRQIIIDRVTPTGVHEDASPETREKVLQAEIEKIQAETRAYEETARTQFDLRRINEETRIREHILQPINTMANLGLTAAFFRGMRAPSTPGAVAAQATQARSRASSVFSRPGHRLR
ncbi:polyprotein [Rice necrosis mosaic virus]|uniref:Genome polyprotein 2 n=1 Tax=Rice necrosis mosaic virus TaxID=59500 RepID=A0A0P0YQ15_9POTY|nr:polyprotein [Rice necrosis mosaic virus]BAT23039.1 polyprotein [Rice necrosis mosaic virus]